MSAEAERAAEAYRAETGWENAEGSAVVDAFFAGWIARPHAVVSDDQAVSAVVGLIAADRERIADLYAVRAEYWRREAERFTKPSEPRSWRLNRAAMCEDVAAIIRAGEGEVDL